MSKKVIAKTEEITHEEWLKLRQSGIGGSDAGAVCGLNKHRTPLAVYNDKTAEEIIEEDNEAMYWGRTLEPVIRDEFTKRTGLKVETIPYVFQYKEYPWMLANIDGIVREKDGTCSLLEIKTVNAFSTADWNNGLPASYYIQVQHYLAVCDLKKAYVAYLIGGNQFNFITVERDEESIQMLIAMEADFWLEHVQKKVPPKINENDGDTLLSMYPQSNNVSLILPETADAFIEEYRTLKQMEDEIKKHKAAMENEIKALMGAHECGKTPSGHSVSWKSIATNRLDTTKLKKEQPEIVAKYTVASSMRKFSIDFSKEK